MRPYPRDQVIALDEGERDQVAAVVTEVVGDIRSEPFDRFLLRCMRAFARLPEHLFERIVRMRFRGEPLLLVRGVPIPEPGRTPTTRPTPSVAAKTDYHRACQSVISSGLGFIYTFEGKLNCCPVDDVYPVRGTESAQVGTNSTFLDWHVEDGFHEAKADYLSLLCIRGSPDAATLLFEPRLAQIHPDLAATLRQPHYTIHPDLTFDGSHNGRPAEPRAVLSGGSDPEAVLDPAYTTACSPLAEKALVELVAAAERDCYSLVLEAGDLLLIDNRRVAHGRTAYSPRYDGSDRWLTRALILESMWKAREHRTADMHVVR